MEIDEEEIMKAKERVVGFREREGKMAPNFS